MQSLIPPLQQVKSLVFRLDPYTRDELYADVSEEFLNFIFLEAIFNTVADYTTNPEIAFVAGDDPFFNRNDPDCVYQASLELLMDVLKEFDKRDGEDVDGPEYVEGLQEHYQAVADKLSLAMSSIATANEPLDFMMFHKLLGDPNMTKSLSVNGKHWGNTVVLLFTGFPEKLDALDEIIMGMKR